jgi:hypothetical protein
MNELIKKLTKYYTMSMFKDTELHNQLGYEIDELEKQLGVEHIYFNNKLVISKVLYEKYFNK